jgi:NitT/TauT family transport system substrate-binding protein
MMRRRPLGRRAAALFATAFLVPAVAGPALSQAAPEMLELRLAVADPGINPVTDSALKLAESLGHYEKHGVRVEIVRLEGTPQVVAALNAGHVDLADLSIDSALRLKADNDVPVRGVVSATLGPPYLIAAKSEITSVEDLVGRTFAVADNGSLDHNLTQHVLAASGVQRDGPRFVTIGPPATRVQALAAGQVDATTVSYGSYLPIADTPGLSIIVQPEDFFAAAPVQSKFVAALEPTIAEKGEAIQRFVEALIDIAREYDGDSDAWVWAMRKEREDLTEADLQATTKFLDGRWCVNGCLNAEYIQDTVDFIYESPDFEGVPVLAATDVIDATFVDTAIEKLGAYEGGGIDARP